MEERSLKDMKSRRQFLRFMGGSAAAGASVLSAAPVLTSCSTLISRSSEDRILDQIPVVSPSTADEVRLASGFTYQIVVKAGDLIRRSGITAGYNNDYLAFFPFDGSHEEGVLCINNESVHPGFVGGYWEKDQTKKSKAQVELEQKSVGVTLVHVRRAEGERWEVVPDSEFNRRVDAQTKIPFAGNQQIQGSSVAIGTLANCAGGVTMWGTYLTCEENYDHFYGEVDFARGRREVKVGDADSDLRWDRFFPYSPEHYGWVVEINPFTGEAKKLTALGRFSHEGATVRPTLEGRPVVYMGDDAPNQCLYKFVGEEKGTLEKGTLYVADLAAGEWRPLDIKQDPRLAKAFKSQLDLLIRTREAAKIVGGTPLDRPEAVVVCPMTGAIYVALTNNPKKGNLHGSILKIEEKGNDPLGTRFSSSTFLAGGAENGFSCPDNLAFDRHGDLWMTSDISGHKMNQGDYASFQNNGLFYIPLRGPRAGKAHLIATAPRDAEFTGPTFSPDGSTLFLSVQHPGEITQDPKAPTSVWPTGSKPLPSVIALSGGFLNPLRKG